MGNVLVTGADGYIGNAVVQRLLKKHSVVGVDSFIKYKWTKDVNSSSIVSTQSMHDKIVLFNRIGDFKFYRTDIVEDVDELEEIFKRYKFDTICNLAQQPSAAYSQKSLHHAKESINNNTNGTLNILWLMHKYCPNAHLIEIESLGTFQPDIGVNIPEGEFVFQYDGRESMPSLFPRRPGSFYHASKVFTTFLNDAAARWWDFKITAINQGVVYGAYTPEIEETSIHSPLWIDEAFGTILNRFIAQSLLKQPLTIYGDGNQKRGFLALNDSVQCVELFVDNPPDEPGLRTPNQMDEIYSINDIATKVGGGRQWISSPRVENTGDFYYNPINDTIKSLGFKQTRTMEQEIEYCIGCIDINLLLKMKDLILPKISWRNN